MDGRQLHQIQAWLGTGSINIFGRPFAGKDTQGKMLADVFDGSLLGGGDILRNSTIPSHINETLHRGELIPSADYIDIVLPYLSRSEFAGRPMILSSVGRWIGEEDGVIAATAAAHHPLKAVIYLELNETEVLKRWRALDHHDDRGGRYDDTEPILLKRLEEYRQKTLPVIDRYEQLGMLLRIDGSGDPEDVHNSILGALFEKSGGLKS